MLVWLFYAMSLIPLWKAWQANRATSLAHTIIWAFVAWAAWGFAIGAGTNELARYVALSLTACLPVAVLGARQPGLAAWNFVVLGLLAVFLLPLAQGWGALRASTIQAVFLSAILFFGFLNYVATRFAFAALLVVGACELQLWVRFDNVLYASEHAVNGLLVFAPLPAWALSMWTPGKTSLDRLWISFRDRFGLIWALRARDQFNRAAAHTGLSARLSWSGLRLGMEDEAAECETILRSLLKRFGMADRTV
jgi:hypothetical protein